MVPQNPSRSEYARLIRRARALLSEAMEAIEAAEQIGPPDRYRGERGHVAFAVELAGNAREQLADIFPDDGPEPDDAACGAGGGMILDDRDEWLCLIWEDTRIPDHQVATLLGLSRRRLRHHVQRLGLGARRAA